MRHGLDKINSPLRSVLMNPNNITQFDQNLYNMPNSPTQISNIGQQKLFEAINYRNLMHQQAYNTKSIINCSPFMQINTNEAIVNIIRAYSTLPKTIAQMPLSNIAPNILLGNPQIPMNNNAVSQNNVGMKTESSHTNINQFQSINNLSKKIKKVNMCGHVDKPHYAKNLCNKCYHKYGRTKKALEM